MALTDNLKAYYKLDGNSNDEVASHNGTDTSITYNNSYGKINQGILCDPAVSKILIANHADFNSVSNISLNAWFRLTSLSTDGNYIIIAKCDNPISAYIYLRVQITGGVAKLKFNGDTDVGVISITGNTSLSINTWYMATVTYNKSKLNLYLNGSSDASEVSTTNNLTPGGTGSVGISVLGDYNVQKFLGHLDEIGWWDRALSTSEITALYNSGNGLPYPLSTTARKTIKGLAVASVKTYKGLAAASVKTKKGLA
jgi:hypothetical protein